MTKNEELLIKDIMEGKNIKIKHYHHIDLDGYGSVVLTELLKKLYNNVEIDYVPCAKNADQLFIDLEEIDEQRYDYILITDLSISEEYAKYIDFNINKSTKLILLDHHIAALHLNKYEWATISPHDIKSGLINCGTSLLYSVIFNLIVSKISNGKIAIFVKYVSDWDTFNWKENGRMESSILSSWFKSIDKETFVETMVSDILDNKPIISDQIIAEVSVINRIIESECKKAIKNLQIKIINEGIYTAGILYANNYTSEIGNYLLEQVPFIDFVMMINPALNNISFRSRKDIGLYKIVKAFGGGGHKLACGMQLKDLLGANFQNQLSTAYEYIPQLILSKITPKRYQLYFYKVEEINDNIPDIFNIFIQKGNLTLKTKDNDVKNTLFGNLINNGEYIIFAPDAYPLIKENKDYLDKLLESDSVWYNEDKDRYELFDYKSID